MRKKDEEVIKKVVDKIIDSKVLLTGDGDFYVTTFKGEIMGIVIRNLFSPNSKIDKVHVTLKNISIKWEDLEEIEIPEEHFAFATICSNRMIDEFFVGNRYRERDDSNDLAKSPSFKRLVEYIEENKHLILHNDKEYGKSHTLTDTDFI